MITSHAKHFPFHIFAGIDQTNNSGGVVRLLLGRSTPSQPSPVLILPDASLEANGTQLAPMTAGPVDIVVDASTVVVLLEDGVLRIAPAAGVICMEIFVEQLSDGSILILDNFGHSRIESTPEYHGFLNRIDIVLGPTGNDSVNLDLVQDSAISKNVTFTSCFGDDVTGSYMGSTASTREKALIGKRR